MDVVAVKPVGQQPTDGRVEGWMLGTDVEDQINAYYLFESLASREVDTALNEAIHHRDG